jgi:hypothetical protein
MPTLTYDLIAQVSGDGSSGTITFSSIPGTFTDLRLVMNSRSTTSTPNQLITFNGDGGTNYSYRSLGTTNSGGVYNAAGQNLNYIYDTIGTNISSFSTSYRTLDIFNYANTNVVKQVIEVENSATSSATLGGVYALTSGQLWRSTAAITTITITIANPYSTDSEFRLFGIKAE